MLHRAIATLRETLRPHLGLSNKRVETLALIVVAMVSARTVNLSHPAAERPGPPWSPRPTGGCSASSNTSGWGGTGRRRWWPGSPG